MATKLRRLKITEVSHVDRGAGETCQIVLFKLDHGDRPYWSQFMSLVAKANMALESTLKVAKDDTTAVAKAHRDYEAYLATAMEELSKTAGAASSTQGNDMPEEMITKAAHDAAVAETAKTLAALQKSLDELTKSTFTPDEVLYASLFKTVKLRKEFLAKTSEERAAVMKARPKPTDPTDDDADDMTKVMTDAEKLQRFMETCPPEIKKQLEDGQEAAKLAKALKDAQDVAKYEVVAKTMNLTGIDAATLRIIGKIDDSIVTKLSTAIIALKKQASEGGLFKEFGTGSEGGQNTGTTAMDALLVKRDEIKKADPKMNESMAFVKACEQNPDLYIQHQQEQRARAH